MVLCTWILTPVIVLVRTLIQVVRDIVRTVCEWVSSTIKKIVEVMEKVCDWLPWPLSTICNWVKKLVEVVETVWSWVCREVIDRVISWIEVLLEYLYYILKWVCWVIDWILFRWVEWLLCRLGFGGRMKEICVHAVILTEDDGTPAVTVAEAADFLAQTDRIYRQCNLRVRVERTELIAKPEYLDGTSCSFGGMFSGFFVWFSQHAAPCCCVTVYFVRTIKGAIGCAYPGTDWVTISAATPPGRRGCVVAQEIGHLADWWPHTGTGTIMSTPCGDRVTPAQCCLIRSSRFARSIMERRRRER
jgi:hypothetical protein